ncbi:TetR/AcrR family transcriptional regulator [Haematomicrobium sanguinis]|uniref:TetR/AcrR family transcriptional regulator n=1 Tax=Haematomicrobium sanguinis TaxID=479106 RepID=UPI0009499232|nr:TetR/AcrR family transcriptional regulator [Haematomicrobium sanguinis]
MAEDQDKISLSPHHAEAARNDESILNAARAVFLADPKAPMSSVAKLADVGMNALYARYASKENLLRALAYDGLERYVAALKEALASAAPIWDAYTTCLERIVEGQSQALAQRVAGTFTPTAELTELAKVSGALSRELFDRVQGAGQLRDDVSEPDVTLLLEMVASIDIPHADRDPSVRNRYLAIVLEGLRAPARNVLPGKPANIDDLVARWRGTGAKAPGKAEGPRHVDEGPHKKVRPKGFEPPTF